MPVIIRRERLPYHPRLGRNINHDSRSREYRVTAPPDVVIRSVRHTRRAPVLDQGNLGSCTGNAGVGCSATGPFGDSLADADLKYGWNEDGAIQLYSDATRLDPYQGDYPPDDTGSDGLSIAKALKKAGEISGYLWAFTPEEARAALMSSPVITGIAWMNDMFRPDPDGRVRPGGGLAGGHEIVADEYVLVGASPSRDDQVWFTNSWGEGWGVEGRFWMTFGDWTALLADGGDVTQFVVRTAPTPPGPPPDDPEAAAGDRLWAATREWANQPHTGSNARAAKAARRWAKDTGRA